KAPPLSKLTLRARRRGGAETLIDSGVLRLSISGRSPGQELSREQGTLNAAGKEQGVLGSALIYAALQNYDGEVRPTRAKALAVPLTPEASAAGSPLNFPHDLHFIPVKKRSGGAIGFLVEDVEKTRRARGSSLDRRTASGRRVSRSRKAGRGVAHYVLMLS